MIPSDFPPSVPWLTPIRPVPLADMLALQERLRRRSTGEPFSRRTRNLAASMRLRRRGAACRGMMRGRK